VPEREKDEEEEEEESEMSLWRGGDGGRGWFPSLSKFGEGGI
jgi:hypothetical protein